MTEKLGNPFKISELIETVNNLVDTTVDDSNLVHKTGNETIGGTKTFSVSPIIPTPATTDNSTKAATTAFVKAQGYTSNAGTITGITMNGSSKGTSGVVNLGTVATSDTKNTAGSTDTSSKIYLVGATSQAANPQTYSHDTAFVDKAGCINSVTPAMNNNSTKVVTTAYVNNKFQVVSALPASPDPDTYYFIPES